MSLSSLYNDIVRLERDIADVHKKLLDESKREFDKQKQIDSIHRSITSSTSASTVQSRMNQIRSYQVEVLNIRKKTADLHKKQADLASNLSRKKQEVLKEEQKEREKAIKQQKDFQRKIETDLQFQRLRSTDSWIDKYYSPSKEIESMKKEYDFFISHASEDKDYAEILSKRLIEANKTVWLDVLVLTIGDSLRGKIDEGLRRSKFGVVLLSEFYFKKFWTNQELSGLVAKEVNGHKIILPIWHKVTRDDVLNYSPTLVDKFALNTSFHTMDQIIEALLNELKD